MSKSLEALDELSLMINREKHINSEWNKKINDLKQTIKQDLELLEQLKQQRDSLAINNGELCVKVADLQKENQELRKSNNEIEELYLKENKHWCEDTDRLRKENEKLLKENQKLKEMLENE